MSLDTMATVWAHSKAPTQSALLVLLAIADHEGDGGAWPAVETLARRARIKRESARQIVRKLEEIGEIRTKINEGGGLRVQKHMRTNVYEVLLECPWYCDHSRQHRDLRDPKNEKLRPPHWEALEGQYERGETPPVATGDPYDGRGTPPVATGTNHPINTQPIETSPQNLTYQHASAQEAAGADGVKESYATWRPGKKVAETAAQARAARRPAKAAPRTPDEQALVDHFQGIECPKGAGLKHWLPPGLTDCARGCGLDLTRQPELENSA